MGGISVFGVPVFVIGVMLLVVAIGDYPLPNWWIVPFGIGALLLGVKMFLIGFGDDQPLTEVERLEMEHHNMGAAEDQQEVYLIKEAMRLENARKNETPGTLSYTHALRAEQAKMREFHEAKATNAKASKARLDEIYRKGGPR